MSNTLKDYPTIRRGFPDASESMSITATVQGEYGAAVQFTMCNDYVVLSENQVRDLIKTLRNRLDAKDGFRATDSSDVEMIHPKPTRGRADVSK